MPFFHWFILLCRHREKFIIFDTKSLRGQRKHIIETMEKKPCYTYVRNQTRTRMPVVLSIDLTPIVYVEAGLEPTRQGGGALSLEGNMSETVNRLILQSLTHFMQ